MYNDIVVGWDAGDGARDALALARLLDTEGGTTTAACIHAGPHPTPELPSSVQADDALGQAAAVVDAGSISTSAVAAPSAVDGLEAIAATRIDPLIVVGSSRHGPVGRVHTGGVGRGLVAAGRHALALPPRDFRSRVRRAKRIAAVFDGAHQRPAVAIAAALAASMGATLHVFCVVPRLAAWARDAGGELGYSWETVSRQHHAQYEELLAEALSGLSSIPASARLIDGETLPDALTDATERLDLLVTGPPATGALQRVVAGITAGPLHSAYCPVLLCGRPTHQPAGDSAKSGATRV